MKIRQLLLCALSLFVAETSSQASTLYGATSAGGPGELWILNAANGSAIQDVGPLNDGNSVNYAVTGLAFNPIDGTLYGSTGAKTGQMLLTIDPATALVTVVGPYNVGAGNTMADIAFDSAGNLYGVSSSGGANLYTINTSTGQAAIVGPSGVIFTAGGGLAISPGGIFYSTPTSDRFGTFNPTSGVYTNIANPVRPAGNNTSYASLAFDGNTLYGMNLGTPTHLVTITPAGVVTDLGASVASIDAIAFQPPPPTPSIRQTANGVVLAWPASGIQYQLQKNSNINTTNWVANTNPTNVVNSSNQVTISPATGRLFFRLKRP